MVKGNNKSIIHDIIFKSFTLISFTIKQLMYSRLNIGIIVLILLPISISGLYASGVLRDINEEEKARMDNPENTFYYFHNRSATENISIIENNIYYNYNENEFDLLLSGTSEGNVQWMDVNIVFYYYADWTIIEDYLNSILSGIGDLSPENIPDVVSDERDIYYAWDYFEASDINNWTSCNFLFYGNLRGSTEEFPGPDINIKIGELNALPFIMFGNEGMFRFGLINFSGTPTDTGWNWSTWRLNLDIGELENIFTLDIGPGVQFSLDNEIIQGLKESRVFWPQQISIYINGYNNETSEYQQVTQVDFVQMVDRNIEEEDEPGHVVFVNAGWILYFTFIIPIIILLYISSAISDDVENRTITYFTSRPISKINLLMSKYFSAYLSAFIMIAPSMILTYFIMSGYKDGMDEAMDNIGILGIYLGLLILGLFVYSAIFMLLAALLKHPLIIGLTYIFFLDQLISNLPFSINRGGINYYLSTIAFHSISDHIYFVIYEPMDPWHAGIILCATTGVLWVFTNLIYSEKDFH